MSDDLWSRVESLLPVRQQRLRKLGRPSLDDRGCLQGIPFVLHTGIQWEWLPQELGFGSGMTGWRRPRDWHEARGMEPVAPGAAIELHRVGELVWSPGGRGDRRLAPPGPSRRPKTGPSPVPLRRDATTPSRLPPHDRRAASREPLRVLPGHRRRRRKTTLAAADRLE
ncbi:transposase [Streptomyces nigrescens]|uniref:Insertion element IS402-like domain-containing protein n=1 Tax=Streptomyces nigrescens TaxID=1920 RepID=A0A640TYR4_STRNI|nr:hypothetical protein Sliba_78140 [Streptomyces libani subsp. libani]GGV96354.1 hypothetical protein GCM10010500_38930 [Streptomyces libani subsp. libani]